jgi:hypothetical protein
LLGYEDFEGAFPGPGWETLDNDGVVNGEYCWAPTNFMAGQGSRSMWPASGCVSATSPAIGSYPNNLKSLAIFGPFDFSGATGAEVDWLQWSQIASGDTMMIAFSTNGVDFPTAYGQDGPYFSTLSEPPTTDGWEPFFIDLNQFLGQPQVWVAFGFFSDAQSSDNGAFVDDVAVLKRAAGVPTQTVVPTSIPTASPTATVPPLATLQGSVSLQRSVPAPHPSWRVQLEVTFLSAGSVVRSVTTTTDDQGRFVVRDIPLGVYDVKVKYHVALSALKTGLAFPTASGTVVQAFGELKAGDADNNDVITAADFTALKQAFGQFTNCATTQPAIPCADFDGNGVVAPSDFTLLKQNFGQSGPTAAP